MANETITGKIFQLKDPSNSYNRFPRTVMEAVYGLNTYLQNQFSALADIYMPIEGITESKPLQEFVYRACPSSIKAKSLTLDRIYGKTLAWNQMVKQDVVLGGNTHQWRTFDTGTTLTANDNELQILKSSGYGTAIYELPAGTLIGGHAYYIAVDVKTNAQTGDIYVGAYAVDTIIDAGRTFVASSNWQSLASIRRCDNSLDQQYRIVDYRSSDFDTVYAKNFAIVDLTLMFGAGNEPSTVEEFESMFPGYHSYEPGKLISNDAESIETVGFNQWDEEWEVGSYYLGEKVAGQNNTIRCKNKIAIFPGETYFYKCQESTDIIEYFDSTGAYIGRERTSSNSLFTAQSNAYYMVFVVSSDYGTTYNHDVCINLSDPAKNGTYEPYRKSTMRLNLGSFQVRDSQGNVTTITGGLKSSGSVYDEIVGNKYIKRVGRVDLGSLNYSIESTFGSGTFRAYLPNDAHGGNSDVYQRSNIICSKYKNSTTDGIYNDDKAVAVWGNSTTFLVKDTNYSSYTPEQVKDALSGVPLYYELATPIEYELVSPLVPTVKAGSTEARISPNSDGLSAPMVADMTYDAHANNDSASAQYALTAGRLLNSHKLWGQDFDGTQDVSGALTGVTSITMNGAISGLTNINSLINISGTNVGIDTANPQYTLDVNGTSRFVGEVHIGTTNSADLSFERADANYINIANGGSLDFYSYSTSSIVMSITTNGYVGIGLPNPSYNLDVNGTFRATGDATFGSDVYLTQGLFLDAYGNNAIFYDSTESTIRFVFDYDSHFSEGIYSDSFITAGGVNASSDRRLKDNLELIGSEKAISILMQLLPKEWIWNEKHYLNGQNGAGLVAQEVKKVLPFAVAKEGEYLSLNYNVFHAYEIAGLQNHEERIKALEKENAELKAKVEQLKMR